LSFEFAAWYFLPGSVGFQDGVQDEQEFSLGGGDDDFEGFAGGGEKAKDDISQ